MKTARANTWVKWKVPAPFSAIYALIADERIMYVGQSTGVVVRLFSHRTEKQFDYAMVMPVPPNRLNEIEHFFISRLAPPWNSRGRNRTCNPKHKRWLGRLTAVIPTKSKKEFQTMLEGNPKAQAQHRKIMAEMRKEANNGR